MPVYTNIHSVEEFHKIVRENTKISIFRFTATWCGPCKRIEPLVAEFVKILPEDIDFYNLDVDVNPEIYSFLKSKRRMNGIPALLCYVTRESYGSDWYIPDHSVIGSSSDDIKRFFKQCSDSYKAMFV